MIMSAWTVDLEAGTATHSSGWIFWFPHDPEDPGSYYIECADFPDDPDDLDLVVAARMLVEAAQAFTEAVDARN
jgi:hypothetical protein